MKNDSIFRPLEKQHSAKIVKRIQKIQSRLIKSIYDEGPSQYLIYEINLTLEATLWLATILLISILMEMTIRDLLFYHTLHKKKVNPFISDKVSILERQIEDSIKPRYSIKYILRELKKKKLIDVNEMNCLELLFERTRNPLHHGLFQRLVRNRGEGSENIYKIDLSDYFGRTDWRDLEYFLEIEGLNIIEEATKYIEKYSQLV